MTVDDAAKQTNPFLVRENVGNIHGSVVVIESDLIFKPALGRTYSKLAQIRIIASFQNTIKRFEIHTHPVPNQQENPDSTIVNHGMQLNP